MKNVLHVGLLLFVLAALTGATTHALAQTRDSEDEDETFSRRGVSDNVRDKVNALGSDAVEAFRVPLAGVKASDVYDSWGDARSGGRTHEGTDILAPRGTFILSPTPAVVARIGTGTNGGQYVYTYNPGGERFYYAHLDEYAEGLEEGQVLAMGDLIGYVGNSGNASGGPTHLHLGIYNRGAKNPYPRLTLDFTTDELMDAFSRIIANADDQAAMVRRLLTTHKAIFEAAEDMGDVLPTQVVQAKTTDQVAAITRDLTLEARGSDVVLLQQFLIAEASGPAASSLASAGATGYFGTITENALAEYQRQEGITPASGYFGSITRATMRGAATLAAVSSEASTLIREVSEDLEIEARGSAVADLQQFLIARDSGTAAAELAAVGATGYFGPLTERALAEFQRVAGISPAAGYYGPITRAYIHSHFGEDAIAVGL